jgi:integrase/recombinase XerD
MFQKLFQKKTMGNITFHAELDSKVKKDGTNNVQIRITQNRKSKRTTIDVAVAREHWNPEKSEVRKGHPQYRQINGLIRSKIIELETLYLSRTVLNKAVTSEGLLKSVRHEIVGDNFFEFAENRINNMASPSTRKGMRSVVKKLLEYHKSNQPFFMEIDYAFLLNNERYLKKQGNGVNTIHPSMKSIKAIYDEALNTGKFITESGSPWKALQTEKSEIESAQAVRETDPRFGAVRSQARYKCMT